MKLSENTVEILKNFAILNQGLVVKKGNILKTVSINKSIKAEALIEEEFKQDFAIYDLNKTLGIFSLNKGIQPEVEVEKDCLKFTGCGTGTIRQRYASPALIFGHDKLDSPMNIEKFEAHVILSKEVYSWIFSVASILGCPNVVIKSSNGKGIQVFAEDVKGAIVDDAFIGINGVTDGPFQAVLKIENLKIIPGDYDVAISKNGITRFKHQTKKIVYYITLESKTSRFET